MNQYRHRDLGELRYAVPDVEALADVLWAGGFEVKMLRGAEGVAANKRGKDVYLEALRATITEVGEGDVLMLALCGHGVQLVVGGRESPYFCPADADPTDDATLVSLNEVLRILNGTKSHNLILVDACRNVAEPDRGRNGGINGTRIDDLRVGTAVFFSCSHRQRARETDRMFPPGSGKGHGVFFHFVLEGLRGGAVDDDGRVTWARLVPFVKERVKKANGDWFADVPEALRQVPHTIESLGDVPPLVDARADPKPGDEREVELADGATMRFCWVPPGRAARLGSPAAEQDYLLKKVFDGQRPDWLDDEGEAARGAFSTRGFWLGKYEATQQQWSAVVGRNPSYFDGVGDNRATGLSTGRFPVERVSWNDVAGKGGFLDRVNARPGARSAFGRPGKFCLPTEDEWEYAARGGRGNGRAFYWGNELDGSQANCNGNHPYGAAKGDRYLERTCAVDDQAVGYPKHPWGLVHIHGNVWEWCETRSGEEKRALRGGAWGSYASNCRAAFRYSFAADARDANIGFRVAFRPD